jgi:VCBS repeat-containing protein
VVITNTATGAFTFAANAAASGSDSFTFKVNDGAMDSNVATILVTIAGNQPPVASNVFITTKEDKSASGFLAAMDPEGTKVTYSLFANGALGTATITNPSTGRFTYLPHANANGTDVFTFVASDGTSTSNVGTVNVTITPVNDAPVASDLAVTTLVNIPVIEQLSAADVDGDPLTYALGQGKGAKHGTVVVLPNGQFTYTPDTGFVGKDSFTFQADVGTASATATVSLTIMGP